MKKKRVEEEVEKQKLASGREPGQKYYPNKSQAKKNRHQSAENAAKTRKKRGTQWRHGRKSKAEVRRSREKK